MGLLAFAIRLTLWRALYGATYAGTNVYDSVVGAMEMAGDEDIDKRRPVLTVTTDEEKATLDGHNWLTCDREIDVVLEMAIFTALKDKSGFEIPHTDDGCEQALNYLGRQVMRLLQVDEGGPWGDLFRTFAGAIVKFEAKRGGGAEKGERIAARQVVITVKPTIGEPRFGVAPEGAWADLIAAMRVDEILADMADGLAAEITGTAIPDWAKTQAELGHPRATLAALGLGPLLVAPLVPGEDEPDPAPANITQITSDGDHLESVVVPDPP